MNTDRELGTVFHCPSHGEITEMHPVEDTLLVRGFKVERDGVWWSQCLVCSGFYNEDYTFRGEHDNEQGWFTDEPETGRFDK